ncbi:heat shock factor protein isoform X2 [Plodia interpunctella]|uniref:heat shock factor protein isoform X2 n=1 Tax=Plodia interpunctella TaxID=58824 RepID=UPI00236780C6|nr:heat shock factor protein isoform X2 [Plodia interpunctella]
MRSVVEIGASVPAFLGKLWKLVNDTETNHLISWSPGGKTFVIKNQADFARELLPLYYKHNNMASFIRQLNMYGFHKITSVENGGLRYEKDEIEFSHPCFMRGHAYLLEHIKRKIANSKSIVSSDSGEKVLLKPELMNKVLADVKQMKGKQESLDAKFSAMKQENEALWREVAILRQKHIKQQQIVNNLIQFLMSLVQPTRPPQGNGNNVGVKRPYQLMINNAAYNSGSDGNYPGRLKNVKLEKEALMEELIEDNLEDGPTIHELAHDDILHNDATQESLDPEEYVSIDVPVLDPNVASEHSPIDPATMQYHVTLEDGDDAESEAARTVQFYPISQSSGTLPVDTISATASPTMTSPASPDTIKYVVVSPGTSRTKTRHTKAKSPIIQNVKSLMTPSNFNSMNPSADLRLPAEIFASDDSVSDAGVPVSEDISVQNLLNDIVTDANPSSSSATKDKMLGGIRLEKSNGKPVSKKAKKTPKDVPEYVNLADIKTELQDGIDWSIATVNNNTNVNRFQSRIRRDNNGKSREELASLLAPNANKNDIDDHLDTMQSDLESLRELLRSDSYSLDTNTLMGLFGSDDPFYGLSYNLDDRAKPSNSAKKHKGELSNVSSDGNRAKDLYTGDDDVEENQLISYTGNIPDFEDIDMPELEGDGTQEAAAASSPCPSTLNTPQVEVHSPATWKLRP